MRKVPTPAFDTCEITHLSAQDQKRILAAVELPPGISRDSFLLDIQTAISRSLRAKARHISRAEVKARIAAVAAATDALQQALAALPPAAQGYVLRAGALPEQVVGTIAEIAAVMGRAATLAEDELSGKGDDRDRPVRLAASVAQALRDAGIDPAIHRPPQTKPKRSTRNVNDFSYWKLVEICLDLTGQRRSDLYPILSAARAVLFTAIPE